MNRVLEFVSGYAEVIVAFAWLAGTIYSVYSFLAK